MICWHKWTKWKAYVESGRMQVHCFSTEMLPFTESRECRECIKCGKTQDRLVD